MVFPAYNDDVWDVVRVPHTWSHDPRCPGFIGAGWRQRFAAPAARGAHLRLAFGAVFARARVWLNGTYLGDHEDGYTPFEFDITRHVKPGADNLVVVCADNRWSDQTLPGARGTLNPQEQVYAWWDDGGVIRQVALIVRDPVYIVRQKIEAVPDLAAGSAEIKIVAWIRNTQDQECPISHQPSPAGKRDARKRRPTHPGADRSRCRGAGGTPRAVAEV